MSAAGITAFVLLLAALSIAWRRSPMRHRAADAGSPPDEVPAREQAGSHGPWCDAIEAISGSAALLLDVSLRLVAAGARGGSLAWEAHAARDKNAPLHLVDVAPADAMEGLLALASSARRGESRERELAWKGKRHRVSATPLGQELILLCVRPLAFLLCCACLSMAACGRGMPADAPHARVTEASPSPRERLASELLREGRLRMRSGRFFEAEELSTLASFLSEGEGEAALQRAAAAGRAVVSRRFEALAEDAEASGDQGAAERLAAIARRTTASTASDVGKEGR